MMRGKVKWLDTIRGFGFIAPDDGGKDVFVHISVVLRSGFSDLERNEPVEFEVGEGPDGRVRAVSVRRLIGVE